MRAMYWLPSRPAADVRAEGEDGHGAHEALKLDGQKIEMFCPSSSKNVSSIY